MLNEAETRLHLIDPILREKGYLDGRWQLRAERPLPVEPTGNKGQRKKGIKPCDYLLCVWLDGMPKALPVGLIEAKAENADPMKGMQQAKGYAADCERLHVPYVFSSNGHRYAEFDRITEILIGTFPLQDFPTHQALTERYAHATGIDLTQPAAQLLFMEDSKAYGSKPRYYQDAAIRAAFEKILRCQQTGEVARVLLSLATGRAKPLSPPTSCGVCPKPDYLPNPRCFCVTVTNCAVRLMTNSKQHSVTMHGGAIGTWHECGEKCAYPHCHLPDIRVG